MKLFNTKKRKNVSILVASDPEPDPDPVPNVRIRNTDCNWALSIEIIYLEKGLYMLAGILATDQIIRAVDGSIGAIYLFKSYTYCKTTRITVVETTHSRLYIQ
jgi:hypothetical protein